MELYYTFSGLIVLASLFAYLNHRVLRLPSTIGIMLMAILASLAIRFFGDMLMPGISEKFSSLITSFDFTEVLMGAMLNFLLFAGAIHVNIWDLREQRLPVLIFSTISVLVSTFFIGYVMYLTLGFVGAELPFIYCLLFGALISPTDPIAVLGILKKANVPKSIETKIAGESLFNDGVAVVLFSVILQLAHSGQNSFSFSEVSLLLAKEALGGLALGCVLGFSASKAIKSIDDYIVSVLITLSVVMGGYLLAHNLHLSSPLTMVAAGLIIGNYGKKVAMSALTKDYLNKFWELIDEIMNSILFLFIGFELLVLPDLREYWVASVLAIGVVLLGRAVSIWLPSRLVPMRPRLNRGTISILIWGGLRGGVSIALVLATGDSPFKNQMLEMTYFVVIFSILVQGLSIGKFSAKMLKES